MKHCLYLFGFLFIVVTLLSSGVQAAEVSSEELFKIPDEYDGKEISLRGEVVGDVMVRGEFAWLNVHDGYGAIGVFAPLGIVQDISYRGDYTFSGDAIRVRGKFHASCEVHGGDTDIHAQKITILSEGGRIYRSIDENKVKLSIVFPSIALLLTLVHILVRRFRKDD